MTRLLAQVKVGAADEGFMTNVDCVGFERLARPLLELIQNITGLETSFVTQIDWDAQRQEIVLALNTAELEVREGAVVDWSNTMCRLALLSGKGHSSDVPTDFPGSPGGVHLGMRTFFSLPILDADVTLGTVCGASRRSVELGAAVIANLQLISEAISFQMTAYLESQALLGRAERAEALSLIDPLTCLANRRGFTSRFEEELARSSRHGSSIAVLALDLDGFKAVNDTYGHPGGDQILVAVADVLRMSARTEDVPARIGGDEFALLLPHCGFTGAETAAVRIAEQFRRTAGDLGMPCTLSIGIGTSESSTRLALLATADEALYRSKALRPLAGNATRVVHSAGVSRTPALA